MIQICVWKVSKLQLQKYCNHCNTIAFHMKENYSLGEYNPQHCIHRLSCRDLGTWTRTRSKEQNKSSLKFSKDLIFNRNLSVNTQSCSIGSSEIYKTYLWCFLRDCSKIPVNNQNYVRSTTPCHIIVVNHSLKQPSTLELTGRGQGHWEIINFKALKGTALIVCSCLSWAFEPFYI